MFETFFYYFYCTYISLQYKVIKALKKIRVHLFSFLKGRIWFHGNFGPPFFYGSLRFMTLRTRKNNIQIYVCIYLYVCILHVSWDHFEMKNRNSVRSSSRNRVIPLLMNSLIRARIRMSYRFRHRPPNYLTGTDTLY